MTSTTRNDDTGLPARADYGDGCYRRSIRLEATGREVRGELADDFHHFAVVVRHDGDRVVDVAGEDVRVPWTTCPGAIAPLRRMEGATLATPLLDLVRYTAPREQCTHLHDLTCLAIAHASRGGAASASTRRYDVGVPDRVDRKTTCTLSRDGEAMIRWDIAGLRIADAEPPAVAGIECGMTIGSRSMRTRLAEEPGTDAAEAAWVLQRAIFIGLGRQHDFERMRTAEAFADVVGTGACHSFAAERVGDAQRVQGTVRDFTRHPERILDRS